MEIMGIYILFDCKIDSDINMCTLNQNRINAFIVLLVDLVHSHSTFCLKFNRYIIL